MSSSSNTEIKVVNASELSEKISANFEIRTCNTIGEYNKKIREKSETHKFIFDDWHKNDADIYLTDSLPIDLVENNLYIITSWNSNTYIRAISSKSFQIEESYGAEFTLGKEYLIILPCY